VLYQIVRDRLETFRGQAARVCDGERLPRFIEDEFEGFLRCGWLAGGFARFRCDGCGNMGIAWRQSWRRFDARKRTGRRHGLPPGEGTHHTSFQAEAACNATAQQAAAPDGRASGAVSGRR